MQIQQNLNNQQSFSGVKFVTAKPEELQTQLRRIGSMVQGENVPVVVADQIKEGLGIVVTTRPSVEGFNKALRALFDGGPRNISDDMIVSHLQNHLSLGHIDEQPAEEMIAQMAKPNYNFQTLNLMA